MSMNTVQYKEANDLSTKPSQKSHQIQTHANTKTVLSQIRNLLFNHNTTTDSKPRGSPPNEKTNILPLAWCCECVFQLASGLRSEYSSHSRSVLAGPELKNLAHNDVSEIRLPHRIHLVVTLWVSTLTQRRFFSTFGRKPRVKSSKWF